MKIQNFMFERILILHEFSFVCTIVSNVDLRFALSNLTSFRLIIHGRLGIPRI